jgi:hypothetical protein
MKKTSRGRSQDRKLVAGGQDYEVRYEAKKTRRSKAAVKKAVKKVGTSRKKVERRLGRRWRPLQRLPGREKPGGSVEPPGTRATIDPE